MFVIRTSFFFFFAGLLRPKVIACMTHCEREREREGEEKRTFLLGSLCPVIPQHKNIRIAKISVPIHASTLFQEKKKMYITVIFAFPGFALVSQL